MTGSRQAVQGMPHESVVTAQVSGLQIRFISEVKP
jgi:hypothetical protein